MLVIIGLVAALLTGNWAFFVGCLVAHLALNFIATCLYS